MKMQNKMSISRIAGALFALLPLAPLYVGCGNINLTGGGSDTEVSGRMLASTGEGAEGTVVALIDTGYDPGFDGPLASHMFDTTDSRGTYHFDSLSAGTYNIWAFRQADSTQALVHKITVISEKETSVDDRLLGAAAYLRILLPDSLSDRQGRISAPGTMLTMTTSGMNGIVDLPAAPQGVLASIRFREKTSDKPIVLYTNVVIDSAGLFVLDPYMNWRHEATISLNTTSGGANIGEMLYTVPVLVRLSATEIDFSQARPEGEDLRFVRPNNSPIQFEIEYWDSATSTAAIWLRIDTIRADAITTVGRMLWGNPDAGKTSQPTVVFDTASGFVGVWHLGESGGKTALDATVNHFDGTPNAMDGSSDVSGIIGRAQDFDGASQCITVLNARNSGLDVQTDSFYTVSAWTNARALQNYFGVVVSKGSAQYCLLVNEWNQWAFFGGLKGYGVDTTTTAPLLMNAWTLLTGVRNGRKQYLYVNGTLADSTLSAGNANPNISDSVYDLVIGNQSDNESQRFNGLVDEVRVENRARSNAWVRFCYENQRTGQQVVQIQKVR
jgi:hypothetical protein